jgi:hypothetical protein
MENLNKKNVVIVLVFVVLLIGSYFVFGKNKINIPTNTNIASVATVNGAIISKATYDTQLTNTIASYKTQGIDVTDATKLSQIKKQVLDDLISNELLVQGLTASGIKSNTEEVEKQFQTILTEAGGAEGLKAELVKNNLTEAQLRENISKQLSIQKYLAQNINVKSITVSEAEIAQFYADYSKAQKDSGQKTVPALKDLSDQIKQQIVSNKQQALVMDFISSLRAKAKIETTI